ncbi:hypothetical protein GUJ93_ZPchr0003g18158 [Zizania palustris]|uniref:Uncharacterized protein n=1 Tax=Zizania palustris TaxID=103762 RepID=A0A8J5SAG6_ZIZPA|nr:hypothetical protein GUJ93_ZPchr0003g18158 [Zizania palustris]
MDPGSVPLMQAYSQETVKLNSTTASRQPAPRMSPGVNLARLEICVFIHPFVCGDLQIFADATTADACTMLGLPCASGRLWKTTWCRRRWCARPGTSSPPPQPTCECVDNGNLTGGEMDRDTY